MPSGTTLSRWIWTWPAAHMSLIIGYHRIASRPIANYDLLLLGFLSKAGGSILGIVYVFWGPLPLFFLLFLFFADIIYLPFFWLILRRIASIRGPLTHAD